MTNIEIIAALLDVPACEVEECMVTGDPRIEMVDIVELGAALDKARQATRASCVNFIRALASVSVGYPVSDERAVLRNVAEMLEKS